MKTTSFEVSFLFKLQHLQKISKSVKKYINNCFIQRPIKWANWIDCYSILAKVIAGHKNTSESKMWGKNSQCQYQSYVKPTSFEIEKTVDFDCNNKIKKLINKLNKIKIKIQLILDIYVAEKVFKGSPNEVEESNENGALQHHFHSFFYSFWTQRVNKTCARSPTRQVLFHPFLPKTFLIWHDCSPKNTVSPICPELQIPSSTMITRRRQNHKYKINLYSTLLVLTLQ